MRYLSATYYEILLTRMAACQIMAGLRLRARSSSVQDDDEVLESFFPCHQNCHSFLVSPLLFILLEISLTGSKHHHQILATDRLHRRACHIRGRVRHPSGLGYGASLQGQFPKYQMVFSPLSDCNLYPSSGTSRNLGRTGVASVP